MQKPSFIPVAAVVFGLVALAHGARLALGLPVVIGTWDVPAWVSWVGVLVTGGLAVWGFRTRAPSSRRPAG